MTPVGQDIPVTQKATANWNTSSSPVFLYPG